MNALRVHLWKEWREHRAVLLGILVALPVLTAATFVGFASFGSQLAEGAAVFTGGAAAMTALALCVELFAGEVSRRTLGFWRRQPGGLAIGWAAKIAMLILAVALSTVWGGLCFRVGCRVFVGAKVADRAWASLSSPEALVVPFLALTLAAWVLLASTWVARGAAAAGIALLLLGAVAFPGFVLWGDRGAFLRTLVPGAVLAALAGIAFPLALSALSIFVGRRRSDRPLLAALVCVAVVALGSGAVYAHARAQLDRWLDVGLGDVDARVTGLFVGKGGRVAFANLTRAGDDSVQRPFAIDLETGVGRPIGPSGSIVSPRSGDHAFDGKRDGAGLIQRWNGHELTPTKATMELFDGATASSLGVFPMEPLEGRALDLVREQARATTPVRTLDGRRAWVLHHLVTDSRGRTTGGSPIGAVETWIERETATGDVDRIVLPVTSPVLFSHGMRLGWMGHLGSNSVFIPADFHSVADCVPFAVKGKGTGNDRIDARRYLYLRFPRRSGDAYSWRVVDVVAETDEPAPGFDPGDSLLLLDGGKAFVWRRPSLDSPGTGARRSGGLAAIDLATGARGPDATLAEGAPEASAWSAVRFLGATPAGKWILDGIVANDRGFVVYDPARHELGRWTRTPQASVPMVAAIVDEDSVHLYEYDSRPGDWSLMLTKVALGSGERSVLFPKRAPGTDR